MTYEYSLHTVVLQPFSNLLLKHQEMLESYFRHQTSIVMCRESIECRSTVLSYAYTSVTFTAENIAQCSIRQKQFNYWGNFYTYQQVCCCHYVWKSGACSDHL